MPDLDQQFHLPGQQPPNPVVGPPVAEQPQPQLEPVAETPPSQSEAVAFARAKLEAIYGGAPESAPQPIQPPSNTGHPDHLSPATTGPPMPAPVPTPVYPVPANVLPIPGQPPAVSRSEQIAAHANAKTGPKNDIRGDIHRNWIRPLIKSALVTALVFLIYNASLVTGQIYYYITPASAETSPIIIDPSASASVSGEPKLIISKLNIDVPVVYDETSFDEVKIQAALQRGVVHYGNTALPGQLGNAVYMGHSSNSPWDPGRFKTAFSILRRLELKDTFVMHFEGKRYIYEVFEKKVIEPTDFSVVNQNVSEPIVTLITCDPPGVNWRRLAIQARQISPDPKAALPAGTQPAQPKGSLPGSPESLFDRIKEFF